MDRAMVVLDGSSDEKWSVGLSEGHYRGYTYSVANIKTHTSNILPTSAICDKMPTGTWDDAFAGKLVLGQTGLAVGFGFDILGFTSTGQLINWLNNNPVQLVYELATPLTISLTPQQISSLVGENHFTIDGGTLSEIELWRH